MALPSSSEPISRVSVIVPTFNAVDTIGVQLDALAAQTYEGEFEVLVCDNGSTDGLRQYVEQHRTNVAMPLTWIDASAVKGVSHARNAGAAAASGDLLVFCDADDRVYPDWLELLVARAETADLISCAVETKTINSARAYSWRPMQPSEEKFVGRFLPFAIGASFGVRTAMYRAVGGCDEAMVNGSEDLDLSWRIQLAGGRFEHEPRAVVAYRVRASIRGVWRQSRRFGNADVELYCAYRSYGLQRLSVKYLASLLLMLAVRNPLVPQSISKLNRGKWLAFAGYTAGTLEGSIRHRVVYF